MDYDEVKTVKISTKGLAGASDVEASFDAKLLRPRTYAKGFENWVAQIKLNVYLRQLNPHPYPLMNDADGRVFWIERWNDADWREFKETATAWAQEWNGKFWLKPPDSFTVADVRQQGTYGTIPPGYRPYIYCHFLVDFTANASNAHKTIDVVKLNATLEAYKNERKYPELAKDKDLKVVVRPSGKTFRSHAVLWDSLDAIPSLVMYNDSGGHMQITVQRSITHEIGHAIGLPHIGVLRKLPLCTLAQNLGWERPEPGKEYPDEVERLVGGKNSDVCYGDWHVDGSAAEDIMGSGETFSVYDGLPWVWAMQKLRNRTDEKWEVLTRSEHAEKGFTIR
jgi:hypothetical protein